MHNARSEAGFTLIEVLVASVILLVGVLGTVTVLQGVSRANAATRERDAATNLARDLIEAVRNVPYDRLTDPGVTDRLQTVPGLENAGGDYTIRRGAVLYGVAVEVCVMDDPRDGGGPRTTPAKLCAGSAPAGTQDRNPEDYKVATVKLTWRRGSAQRSITQSGIVTNPGSANGPSVRSIAPRGLVAPYLVTNPYTPSIVVDITTSSKPHAVNWLLDGTVQQPAPVMNGPSGLLWTFTWNIGTVDAGVLDGDYIVSAEAFNQYGVSGPGRQDTVILNRRIPKKPGTVTGDLTNFGTVAIEWPANSERDIAGYEVLREDSNEPVCALAQQQLDTTCVDPTPPAGVVRYRVYAYDKDPTTNQPRRGDPSDVLAVDTDNRPPYPATGVNATRAANGTVTLTWQRPSPEDPDAEDGVQFYRVYRDGKALENRYVRWFDDAETVTWQDTATGGTTHTYWVTAVDKHNVESAYAEAGTA